MGDRYPVPLFNIFFRNASAMVLCMKKIFFFFLFGIIVSFGLGGCTSDASVSPRLDSSETSLFEHISSEEKSQSIVYLYRPFKFYSGVASPWVTVDGYKTVLLGNNQYTRLVVRPGYHMVQTERSDNWISGQPDILHLSVKKGKIHFLKISIQTEWYLGNWFEDFFMGFLCPSCEEYHMAKDTFKIEMVDHATALLDLKKTKYVAAL
ncbi:MAG: DUF2846 domain-containing protein [Nitrospirales bacterium]